MDYIPEPDLIGDEFPGEECRRDYQPSLPDWPNRDPKYLKYTDPLIIPPAYGRVLHSCATCHRLYFTRDGYRGHWLLVHFHHLALD